MEIRVYFEGNSTLRAGFEEFCSSALAPAKRNFRFIAAKDGPAAYAKALRSNRESLNLLLKDSEEPIPKNVRELCRKRGIDPSKAKSVFWMVEAMESWFLADPDAVEGYFSDQRFSRKALGDTANVETIPKQDVFERLRQATAKTKKGAYSKSAHAQWILGALNPAQVRSRASHCEKFFKALHKILHEQ